MSSIFPFLNVLFSIFNIWKQKKHNFMIDILCLFITVILLMINVIILVQMHCFLLMISQSSIIYFIAILIDNALNNLFFVWVNEWNSNWLLSCFKNISFDQIAVVVVLQLVVDEYLELFEMMEVYFFTHEFLFD